MWKTVLLHDVAPFTKSPNSIALLIGGFLSFFCLRTAANKTLSAASFAAKVTKATVHKGFLISRALV